MKFKIIGIIFIIPVSIPGTLKNFFKIRMGSMKKVFLILLIASMLIGLFKVVNAVKKVIIWCWDPNFNVAIMEEVSNRYQKLHPDVEFEVVSMAKADVEQKLNTILASGVKRGFPEIVLMKITMHKIICNLIQVHLLI